MKKLTMISFVVGGRRFTSFVMMDVAEDGKVRWTYDDMNAIFDMNKVFVPRGTTVSVGA